MALEIRRNCRTFGRDPTLNVARSVDNIRAITALRKRVNKHLTNALSVQLFLIKLVCFLVKQPFIRRCPTVPVHRRPALFCQLSSAIRKSDQTSENVSKPKFFTPNTQNNFIAFGGAKTFWDWHSSWRPVQRRLDSAIWDTRWSWGWVAPLDCALFFWKLEMLVKTRQLFWTRCI